MTPAQTRAAIFGCQGLQISPLEARFFAAAAPWGFILFARNVESPKQLNALTAELRTAVGWDCPILIDQEGGRVARMTPPAWRAWSPPLAYADLPPRAMWLRARLIAAELRAIGIDVNCTPIADVAQPQTHPFLRNRTYGVDVSGVIDRARANAAGTLAGGVLPVLKHIPGHGRATVDSHLALPRTDAPLDTLEAVDFAPFRALNDLPLGMSAHVVYDALDPTRPGTISPQVQSYVRNKIGFEGLIMTDDLSMRALPGDVVSRATSCLSAGIDLVLHCNGDLTEMEAISATLPVLTAPQRTKADVALALRTPQPIDIEHAEAELGALIKGGAGDAGRPV